MTIAKSDPAEAIIYEFFAISCLHLDVFFEPNDETLPHIRKFVHRVTVRKIAVAQKPRCKHALGRITGSWKWFVSP